MIVIVIGIVVVAAAATPVAAAGCLPATAVNAVNAVNVLEEPLEDAHVAVNQDVYLVVRTGRLCSSGKDEGRRRTGRGGRHTGGWVKVVHGWGLQP